MADEVPISDPEKSRIASHFIIHAPPGEFNEVFSDVRILLNSDRLLKSATTGAITKHNEEQFVPVILPGGEKACLVTEHGALGGDRYFDPKSKKSFKFDHMRKVASDLKSAKPDSQSEPSRSALEKAWSEYTKDHYPAGVSTVYGTSSGNKISLAACTEDHKFNPKNFYNGRWRSEWSITFSGPGTAELKGILRIQVHYYEDGNVQLVSSKEVKQEISVGNEAALAKEIVKVAEHEENNYQAALGTNYKAMSDTTFKALRRALPVTRSRLDWAKIAGYKVGKDLK